jgi:hypothetical protein
VDCDFDSTDCVLCSAGSLPYTDDYDSIPQCLLKRHSESGFQHIAQIVTAQHNEYRLTFESAIFGIQYEILGRTNLEALSTYSSYLFFFVLCLIWKDFGRSGDFALLRFVPASWMVFQLQYASTLNFAIAKLLICISVEWERAWNTIRL